MYLRTVHITYISMCDLYLCVHTCSLQYYDLAADVLADYSSLTYKYLDDYLYRFLDAKITQQTSPEEVRSM